MELGASKKVMEQSQVGTTIKTEKAPDTSAAYIDIEIDLNHLKQEPGLVQSMKCETAMFVKKEFVENVCGVDSEQQCDPGASTPASTGSFYEANSLNQCDWINVKPELEVIDIGPTVLQHMDIHYALNKSTVDGYNKVRRCSKVKKGAVDKLKDYLTPHKAIKKERSRLLQSLQRTVHEDCLASLCSVHVTRLDVFQCDLCRVVYTEKLRLLHHLQTGHASPPRTSLILQFRKTNKRTVSGNRAISHNCGQITTEVGYDEAHIKSRLGQQKDQQHILHHNCTTSSNSFKCDGTFHKPHLQSLYKKLHQQNRGSSNQSGDKTKTKQKPFEVCKKRYSSNSGLILHKHLQSFVKLKSHLANYEYVSGEKLDQCDPKFAQSDELTKQMGDKPYQCKICDARFARNGDLTQHMRVHTGEKPFQCKMCDARFTQSSSLSQHVRVHMGEKPYQCKVCNAKFARNSGLTQHVRVHTGEKPYQCKICDAKFARSSGLTEHVRVHTGEKPYQCKICDTRFALTSHLARHMSVHTGEKPYQCKMCEARFAHSSYLTRHMRVHTGEKPYQCKLCDAKFARSYRLSEHMWIHPGEKRCDTCDLKFAQNGDSTKHTSD